MQIERMVCVQHSWQILQSFFLLFRFLLSQPSISIKLNEERKVTRAVSNYTVDLFNATAILSCETFSALYVFHDALQ